MDKKIKYYLLLFAKPFLSTVNWSAGNIYK